MAIPKDKFARRDPISLLTIIVAAYNEVSTIENSIMNLIGTTDSLPFAVEIIVVESNSTDGTRELLRKMSETKKINLILQDSPEGKGSAIRLGMKNMSGDVFLIYDADTEYDPNDIPKLLTPIMEGVTSFVLGTRHEEGRAMRVMEHHTIRPIIMNLAHKVFTALVNIACKTKLTDPFTMYKIFRSEVFESVPLISNRFDFDWELVIKAIRRGAIPIEIPVAYISRSFSEGKKIKFISDPISWLIALIKFRFSRVD